MNKQTEQRNDIVFNNNHETGLIKDLITNKMIDYGLSVLVSRAIPDIRDGLKTVHRRLIYNMFVSGFLSSKPYKKNAAICGETIAKFHPRGIASTYQSLVRLSQPFKMITPLIDFSGNYGAIDGASAGDYRYTESRLSKFTEQCLLEGINKNAVEFRPNYLNDTVEPMSLPSSVPNILLTPQYGIAYGYVCSYPSYNLKEVCNMIIDDLEGKQVDYNNLMPDFVTGGEIINKDSIYTANKEGKGNIIIRSKIDYDANTNSLIVSEIPYNIPTTDILDSIIKKFKEKKLEFISDVDDLTDRHGLQIIIKLKKGSDPCICKNILYKETLLESSYGINFTGLEDFKFDLYDMTKIVKTWIEYRKKTIKKIIISEMSTIINRIHTIEGLLKALEFIDDVIAIMKQSENTTDAAIEIVKKLGVTSRQASFICDMSISRLTNSKKSELIKEHKELKDKYNEKLDILVKEEFDKIMVTELKQAITKFGLDRKTKVTNYIEETSDFDSIEDEDYMLFITKDNYLKKVKDNVLKTQNRNTKGIKSGKVKKDDFITNIYTVNSRDYLMIFTDKGNSHKLYVKDIEESSLDKIGTDINNYITLDGNIDTIIPIAHNTDTSKYHILLTTKYGKIKRVPLTEFDSNRNSLIATKLNDGDSIVSASLIGDEDKDILITVSNGNIVRYSVKDIPVIGRTTLGTSALQINNNHIVSVCLIESDNQLIITKQGIAKNLLLNNPKDEVKSVRRASTIKGVKAITLNEDDEIVSSINTNTDVDAIVITNEKINRIAVSDISTYLRPAKGLKLIDLAETDYVKKAIIIQ